jgi:hypothetical protein
MCKKTKIMIISREPSALQIQLENAECFNYLGNMRTNDAPFAREIQSRISMPKTVFIRKETLFTSKLDLTSEVLRLKHAIVSCSELAT